MAIVNTAASIANRSMLPSGYDRLADRATAQNKLVAKATPAAQRERPTNRPKAVVAPDGTVYQSMADAARAEGVHRETIHNRVRSPTQSWRYSGHAKEVRQPETVPSRKVIGPDGTLYSSIGDASRASGLHRITVARLAGGDLMGWRFA